MLPTFLRNAHTWLPGYLADRKIKRRQPAHHLKVWLTIADHYEPYWRKAGHSTAVGRVRQWSEAWPRIAQRHRDSNRRPPKYTFFYAEEDYHPSLLAPLSEMAAGGVADVEVHLHHDGEGENDFVTRMQRFTDTLYSRHGLLREQDGRLTFGFIHGNWALGNSLPHGRWCGLHNELSLLRKLGCYADFTLPAAPHAAQTAMVNTIYWAKDDPSRPKPHNRGTPLLPGQPVLGDLLIIPGPLGLNFRGARRVLPRLETGELAHYDPPVAGRARSWLQLAPRIADNVFLKLYTHGAQEANAAMLLGRGLDDCFEDLRAECDRRGHELHFASAWEMSEAIDAVRRGDDPPAEVQKTASTSRSSS